MNRTQANAEALVVWNLGTWKPVVSTFPLTPDYWLAGRVWPSLDRAQADGRRPLTLSGEQGRAWQAASKGASGGEARRPPLHSAIVDLPYA